MRNFYPIWVLKEVFPKSWGIILWGQWIFIAHFIPTSNNSTWKTGFGPIISAADLTDFHAVWVVVLMSKMSCYSFWSQSNVQTPFLVEELQGTQIMYQFSLRADTRSHVSLLTSSVEAAFTLSSQWKHTCAKVWSVCLFDTSLTSYTSVVIVTTQASLHRIMMVFCSQS